MLAGLTEMDQTVLAGLTEMDQTVLAGLTEMDNSQSSFSASFALLAAYGQKGEASGLEMAWPRR